MLCGVGVHLQQTDQAKVFILLQQYNKTKPLSRCSREHFALAIVFYIAYFASHYVSNKSFPNSLIIVEKSQRLTLSMEALAARNHFNCTQHSSHSYD
jgi:hypothetical protein